jgi:hypothetical protein
VKAIVYHRYGPPDVLRLEEVPRPIPGDKEVLVRVHAATLGDGTEDYEIPGAVTEARIEIHETPAQAHYRQNLQISDFNGFWGVPPGITWPAREPAQGLFGASRAPSPPR